MLVMVVFFIAFRWKIGRASCRERVEIHDDDSSRRRHTRSVSAFLLNRSSDLMFQTFISRHNSNFFSDKLVLTSVTPASSAPVLQTPKATSSTLYFDSLTVNAGNGGFLHCIQMDTSVN